MRTAPERLTSMDAEETERPAAPGIPTVVWVNGPVCVNIEDSPAPGPDPRGGACRCGGCRLPLADLAAQLLR